MRSSTGVWTSFDEITLKQPSSLQVVNDDKLLCKEIKFLVESQFYCFGSVLGHYHLLLHLLFKKLSVA